MPDLPLPQPRRIATCLPGLVLLAVGMFLFAEPLWAQTDPGATTALPGLSDTLDVQQWVRPEKISGTAKTVLLLAVISLAPAIAMMTTSFVRIVVVLGILRQALGAQQIPSTQIMTGLALFMSFLIMAPVWNEIKTAAVDPYTAADSQMSLQEAWDAGCRPVKRFMSRQIDAAGNVDDIWLFYRYLPESQRESRPRTFDDIPLHVLLPAFMISELKVAFLIGFQVLMPFLVIDLVVTSVTTSLGMIMLPPTMVSLPLKLIMFVLVDGWNLVVGMLMQSFGPGV
jgi:flagellar biosynthetic protein FliP